MKNSEAVSSFPFEQVFSDLDGDHSESTGRWQEVEAWSETLRRTLRILNWIAEGKRAEEKSIRLQVVRGLMSGKSQQDMALEIGVTRAAVCRLAQEFFVDFALIDRDRLVAHMRSSDAAARFSIQCKRRHQQRQQAQQQLTESAAACN